MANSEFVTNIDQLENVGALDTAFLGEYEDAQLGGKELPPEGVYSLRMPDQFGYKLSDDKKALQIEFNAIIVGGPYDGYEIKYVRVSTRKFKQANASTAGDLMRNFGEDPTELKTTRDWNGAFERIAGKVTPAPVYCQWRGWDKKLKAEIKGQKNFPVVGGKSQGYEDRPDPDDPDKTYRVWANLQPTVRGFSPVGRT
jgi:hypothetical protein